MLLPLACVATGHCRGQKYLNGARNQLGIDIGENPVKGYLKQLHRYKLRLKRPLITAWQGSSQTFCLPFLPSSAAQLTELPEPTKYWAKHTSKAIFVFSYEKLQS